MKDYGNLGREYGGNGESAQTSPQGASAPTDKERVLARWPKARYVYEDNDRVMSYHRIKVGKKIIGSADVTKPQAEAWANAASKLEPADKLREDLAAARRNVRFMAPGKARRCRGYVPRAFVSRDGGACGWGLPHSLHPALPWSHG